MVPAQPPLPTAWNLPFQFSTGIHTSMSIDESDEGFNVAATRQCAGNRIGCAGAAAPRPAGPPAAGGGAPVPGPGGVNGPAATRSAAMIVVSGSVSDFRFWQG